MANFLKLSSLRAILANKWLLLFFGAIYFTSQVVIATLLHPLDTATMLGLQVTGWSPEVYRETFAAWEAQGVMQFYHAHFIFDDIHWVWYAVFLSVALALSLDAARLSARWNVVLTFPLIAGVCDWIENTMQHVFLSGEGYQAIIDPLPAISTSASIIKWLLALGSIALILGLQFARSRGSE